MAIKASFPGWEGLGFEGTLRSDKFRCAASVGIVLMFLLSRDLRGVNPQSRPGSQKAKVRGFSHFFTPGLGLLLVIGLGPSWTVWGVILLYSAAKASPAILRLHSGFFVFFFAGVSIIWCLLCFVDPSCPIFLPPEALALDPVSSRVGQHVSYHSGLAIAC